MGETFRPSENFIANAIEEITHWGLKQAPITWQHLRLMPQEVWK